MPEPKLPSFEYTATEKSESREKVEEASKSKEEQTEAAAFALATNDLPIDFENFPPAALTVRVAEQLIEKNRLNPSEIAHFDPSGQTEIAIRLIDKWLARKQGKEFRYQNLFPEFLMPTKTSINFTVLYTHLKQALQDAHEETKTNLYVLAARNAD